MFQKARARRAQMLAERERERQRQAQGEEAMEVSSTSQEASSSAVAHGAEGGEEAMDMSVGARGSDMEREVEEELKVDEWDGVDLTPVS